MKIVCDNCATKYSIADEKVRGKVFKIRCKKCSHIIVVRGGADGSVEATSSRDAGPADGGFAAGAPGGEEQQTIAARDVPATGGGEAGGDSVWHLVIDREQVGPLTPAEVRAKFAGGEVDAETYAWREGFGDWLRLGSIDDFRDLGEGAAPAPDPGATKRTDSADLFAGAGGADEAADAPAGDLFGGGAPAAFSSAPAPASASPNEDVFGGGGGALFGAPSAAPAPAARAPRSSSPGFSAASESSAPASNGNVVDVRPMTGQRNENSVLFSLNNLQALATGGAAPAGKPAGGGAGDARPGFANSQTEGSGLIDIRAMAASTLAASPSTGGSSGRSDDLPGLGAAPVFSPMAAPILMPAASSEPPKWMWPLLGVGVLAVIGIVVVGALILTRKPAEPMVVQQPAVPAAAAPASAAAAPPAAATKPAAAPAGGPASAAATPAPATAPAAATDEAGAKKHAGAKPAHEKGTKLAKSEAAAAPKAAAPEPAPAAAAPAVAAPKKSSKHDELDALLDGASPGDTPKSHKSAAREESSGGDDNVAETLSRTDIQGGMSKVKGRVLSCFEQFKVPGTANVAISVANSGRVSSANVTGQFAGTPTGECVARAVKSASFPRFKGSPMSFVYPYLLR